jgi:NAD(P)-dependent dehydrogenase (short-subunit alcohol dehydrogenase family)
LSNKEALAPVALITGVGPGTGAALVRRFAAGGYRIAMLARNADRLERLAGQVENAHAFGCDVENESEIDATVTRVVSELGQPSVFIHNAVGGVVGSRSVDGIFGNFLEMEPQALERNFRTNTMALLHFARRLAPSMVAKGNGAIIVTGNTSALRGKPNFAAFAPTKAAQRILSESMARQLGPQGVHVAYVVIDAVIDVPWTRGRLKDAADDFFIKPDAIASEIWHLTQQDRSAWSFNVEIRPFREPW